MLSDVIVNTFNSILYLNIMKAQGFYILLRLFTFSQNRQGILSTSDGNRFQVTWSINHPFFRAMIEPQSISFLVMSKKHIPELSICQGGRNNGVPTFRIYQKNSLPVNMAVHINKPKIRYISADLLRKLQRIFIKSCRCIKKGN